MIESPLIQEIEAKSSHKMILGFLRGRFGQVPEDIVSKLSKILDPEKLVELAEFSGTCKDLKEFRKKLRTN